MTVVQRPSSAALQQKFLHRLKLGLGLKDDTLWNLFLASGRKSALIEFISSRAACSLIFYTQSQELIATIKPGARPPAGRRCVFFIRPSSQPPLSLDNFDTVVASGEATAETLPFITGSILKQSSSKVDHGSIPRQHHTLPMPAADYATLERSLSDIGYVLDRSTVLQLESTASAWISIIDAAIAGKRELKGAERKENQHSAAILEADSWSTRTKTLQILQEELKDRATLVVLDVLLRNQSPVAQRLQQSIAEVENAFTAAQSIAAALQPMRALLDRLVSSDDLLGATDCVTLCMHGLLLAWHHCTACRSQTFISDMVHAMAEDIVQVATRCVYGAELLQGDLVEAAEKARAMLRLLGHAKSCYADARSQTMSICPSDAWGGSGASFLSVDALMARCQDVHTVSTTFGQYSKLERIDFGGPQGGTFTATARQLHCEYAAAQEKLITAAGDPLDLGSDSFPTAFAIWRQVVSNLDARLAVLVGQILSNAPTFEASSRIIDSLESLSERPSVRRQVESVYIQAIKTFTHEVRAVAEVFECQKSAPPLPFGSTPCAGTIAWIRGLQDRVSVPMSKLRTIPLYILESDAGREMVRVYEAVLKMLRSFEESVMTAWCEVSQGISEATIRQPVLRSNNVSNLQVNFDPSLSMLLKETRSLTAMPGLLKPIPSAVTAFYQRESILMQQITALGKLAEEINTVRATLLQVEAPLIASALGNAEQAASKGQKDITWASAELDAFSIAAQDCGRELSRQFKALRSVTMMVEAESQRWLKDFPITDAAFNSMKRVSTPLQSFVELHSLLTNAMAQRKRTVAEGAERLKTQFDAAVGALGGDSLGPYWVAYRDYAAMNAAKGLQSAMITALEGVMTLLSAGPGTLSTLPLLTVALQLAGDEGLQWSPQLGTFTQLTNIQSSGLPNSVAESLQLYSEALVSLCSTTVFLESKVGSNPSEELGTALKGIAKSFSVSLKRCESISAAFLPYEAIWKAGTSSLPAFAAEQDQLPLQEIEAEIQRLRRLQEEVQTIDAIQSAGWLAVDREPAKQTLSTMLGKRIVALTDMVKAKIESRLKTITSFMEASKNTIQNVPAPSRAAGAPSLSTNASRRASAAVLPPVGHRSSLISARGASIMQSTNTRSPRSSVFSTGTTSSSSRRPSAAAPAGLWSRSSFMPSCTA